jgi:hypothetical protein
MNDSVTTEIKLKGIQASIKVIICDNIYKVFNRGIYLRGFYNSLSDRDRNKIYTSAGTTVKLTKRLGNALYYVVLKRDVDTSIIAHEAFHLVMRIMGGERNMNRIINDNEEEYAYLLQESFRKILTLYNKYNHL